MSTLSVKQRRELDAAHATAVSALRQVENALQAAQVAFGRRSPATTGVIEEARDYMQTAVGFIAATQAAADAEKRS